MAGETLKRPRRCAAFHGIPPPHCRPRQLVPWCTSWHHVLSTRVNAHASPRASYMRSIELQPDRPSDGVWVRIDKGAERVILADFQRLWTNHVLADLSVEVLDYKFSNGVVGKLVAYHITEEN